MAVTKASLVVENAQLRQALAEAYAELQTVKQSLERATRRSATVFPSRVPAFVELVKAYCAAHGVKSCTKAQALSMVQA